MRMAIYGWERDNNAEYRWEKYTVSKCVVRREMGIEGLGEDRDMGMESIVGERLECKVYVGGERKKFM